MILLFHPVAMLVQIQCSVADDLIQQINPVACYSYWSYVWCQMSQYQRSPHTLLSGQHGSSKCFLLHQSFHPAVRSKRIFHCVFLHLWKNSISFDKSFSHSFLAYSTLLQGLSYIFLDKCILCLDMKYLLWIIQFVTFLFQNF